MNEIFQAIVLGIVQGASEFLPISSSGHLVLVPYLLNWHGVVDSLSFDVALHIGTTVAVAVFFYKDWLELITAFFTALPRGFVGIRANFKARFFLLLIIGSLPAAVLGLLFQDFIENKLREPSLIAILLIIFGLVLFYVDRLARKNRDENSIGLVDSILVGLAQALALFPGVSRSGATITVGLFRGLDRRTATRFSFLLSTPIILGAGLVKVKDIVQGSVINGSQLVFLIGLLSAAISGWVAIKLLLKFVQSNNFTIFVVYRLIVGAAVLLVVFSRSQI